MNRIATLQSGFDAVLNFAARDDEEALAARLAPRALGYATTVQPLLSPSTALGRLHGPWTSKRNCMKLRTLIAKRAPKARYTWILFKHDREALAALACGVREGRFSLPLDVEVSLEGARAAFEHVAAASRAAPC